MYDEHIKSRLIKDIRFFKETKDQNDQKVSAELQDNILDLCSAVCVGYRNETVSVGQGVGKYVAIGLIAQDGDLFSIHVATGDKTHKLVWNLVSIQDWGEWTAFLK